MSHLKEAIAYTREEMIPYVASRADRDDIPFREKIKDLKTVVHLINWQADHLLDSSEGLVYLAAQAKVDLDKKLKK